MRALHVGGALGSEDQALFRAHILVCADCRESYRGAVGTTAKVGRAMSAARFDRAKRERRQHVRSLPFKVGSFGRSRKWYGMRAVLGTALLITLVTRIPGSMGPATLMATWENGSVHAGTRDLNGGAPEGKLVTGDWVVTQQTGAVEVTGHGGKAELGPGTALLIEDPKGFRIRLTRGTLDVSGSGQVLTQYGVLEFTGDSVRLMTTVAGLEIHTLDGNPAWTHPLGTDELKAGSVGIVAAPGPLVAER
ncbi:MAG: hypothetical protein ACI8QS_000186 [Planctomycetota bacterium]|jgi:hypothetical protein